MTLWMSKNFTSNVPLYKQDKVFEIEIPKKIPDEWPELPVD